MGKSIETVKQCESADKVVTSESIERKWKAFFSSPIDSPQKIRKA
jgi:hypothetical protein